MQNLWRIKDLLEWTTRYFLEKGIQEPRLEAEVLLACVLKKNRVYLYANYESPVNSEEREKYRQYIKRRVKGEPIAYISGQKEFMSLEFIVSPEVLIPRPETEVLVEKVLELADKDDIHKICDVGTGSGAIAISLASFLKNRSIYAVDLSVAALDIARKNAEAHQVNINFIEGDLMEAVEEEGFDLITANLPYVSYEQWSMLDGGVKDFEPRAALIAGGDGLDIYRRLLPQARNKLRSGGYLLIEIDPGQSEAAREIFKGFGQTEIIKDWTGRDRIVKARRI